MDPTLAVIAAAVLGFFGNWLTGRIANRNNRNNSMLEWAKQLQSSEQAARKEAAESRDRAERIKEEANQDVAAIRDQLDGLSEKLRSADRLADRLNDTLASVQAEVWRPEPDIEAVRRLVGRPQQRGTNGR